MSRMDKYRKRFAGRLLLRSELNLGRCVFNWLIQKHYLTPVASFKINRFSNECMRCGNKNSVYFGNIPCSSCQSDHFYCRYCVQMGRVTRCEPLYIWTELEPNWQGENVTFNWQGELTSRQQVASDALLNALEKRTPEFLIHAVCGAGKTEMLFHTIYDGLKKNLRIALATPRRDVVKELLPRFEHVFCGIQIVAQYGGSPGNKRTAQLTLATTHQLIRYREAFDLLIIDEVDAFPFHHDKMLQFVAKRSVKLTGVVAYLTATPRKDLVKRKLPTVFVPVRYHGHPLPVPQVKPVFKFHSTHLPNAFWSWFNHRLYPDRQLLFFTATIEQADLWQQNLQQMLPEISIASVHANDSNRQENVDQFRQKTIDILFTTTILERGVTFKAIDVVILDASHRVFDQAALIQIAGRVGRSGEAPTGEVIFFHDGLTTAINGAIRDIKRMNRMSRQLGAIIH
ncbi:competence protein ComFA [Pelagirhabdus alkalitolerans]|uniref:Competence protein ComFA n=2 Tax=Pelagirhabdus alkalitolerans TaxID=1612202 RepID=A0A1G6L415_9BACI|nr:competence protein ComFA [Pelagirhabdus alkalitolerans]